ncbi:DUF2835 domain-containing protein [Vibrio sp.]|uniref:DUF2835 family protein n=1 Tax=Vibrio viridaestus TaxID=2487322 RepID=A0A3N9TGZ6_9VIBR|nr:DUF2835 domain-containing protein [Vibrio viridaestus]MDC0612319.1 DUF2835 domain-containing protein [Vibrio sp.]RQW63558.1 DUF2835 family protein [Vibrio viridaestus]
MNSYYFSLHISYVDFHQLYTGAASTVLVTTENGLRLQLPASRLRPFLSQLGIRGRFKLSVDNHNKIIAIESI